MTSKKQILGTSKSEGNLGKNIPPFPCATKSVIGKTDEMPKVFLVKLSLGSKSQKKDLMKETIRNNIFKVLDEQHFFDLVKPEEYCKRYGKKKHRESMCFDCHERIAINDLMATEKPFIESAIIKGLEASLMHVSEEEKCVELSPSDLEFMRVSIKEDLKDGELADYWIPTAKALLKKLESL